MAGGRPSKYKAEMCERVKEPVVMAAGATLASIAQACGVSIATVETWMQRHPEFLGAVKEARDIVDDSAESSMIKAVRAGNVTAQIFWLCNRRPDRWKHVQRIEHTGEDGGAITIAELVRRAAEDD
jgi:hypothetical protein